MEHLSRLVDTDKGQIIVSILLGLGLAALFRKVCSNNSCVIVQGPDPNEVSKSYYRISDDCYKYTPVIIECG